MNQVNIQLLLLLISIILTASLLVFIGTKKSKSQLQKVFSLNLICILIISFGVLVQEYFTKRFNCDPIVFENFIYIGTCMLPVSLFFTGLVFSNTKVKFKKKYFVLFVVPILSLLMLWTNDFHHLFFTKYSTNLSEFVAGPYLTIHNIYTYGLILIGLIYLLKFSFKNSGFFSKQSILILLGISIPVVVNSLGVLKIISMSVYATPISFSITMLLCAVAMFKFDFLGVAPIAIQKIVDRISDSYLVLDDNRDIIDYNKTFINTFKIKNTNIRGKNIDEFLKTANIYLGLKDLSAALTDVRNTNKTIVYEQTINKIHKTFTIEINTIDSDDGAYLGTLILFKDITQHKEDMETIKNNQNILMERERLASLGQLIGGIAHNLKTPIMSIAGAAEGISDLVKEMDASVGNPVVTEEDFHEIAKDMNEWVVKIKSYSEYMSDIISAVKGQAVTLSNEEATDFTVVELFKRIDILMRHELKKSVVYLNSSLHVPESTSIKGDINSLVQVINNMISNAIQSYNGEPEKSIDLSAKLDGNNVVISVKDYGPGLPDKVKDKLFKEMITTKGKNGTGLGLYMSYSTIRAHFGGDIIVDTEKNKGTTFNVVLPIAK